MLIIISASLAPSIPGELDDGFYSVRPFLEDAWRSRDDIGPDFVPPGEKMNVKTQEFEPTSKLVFPSMEQMNKDGLYPPRDKDGNIMDVPPFFWKLRGGREPTILRWIWHPVTGEFILSERDQHSMMVPYDWETGESGVFEEYVRGFWEPKTGRVLIRPYFNPRTGGTEWNDEHASVNAKITQRISQLLKSVIEPHLGEPLKIVNNVDNDDVMRYTGWKRV